VAPRSLPFGDRDAARSREALAGEAGQVNRSGQFWKKKGFFYAETARNPLFPPALLSLRTVGFRSRPRFPRLVDALFVATASAGQQRGRGRFEGLSSGPRCFRVIEGFIFADLLYIPRRRNASAVHLRKRPSAHVRQLRVRSFVVVFDRLRSCIARSKQFFLRPIWRFAKPVPELVLRPVSGCYHLPRVFGEFQDFGSKEF